MKKALTLNFLTMTLSWALFTDHKTLAAFIIAMLACIYLYLKNGSINIKGSLLRGICISAVLYLFFRLTSLDVFYALFDQFVLISAVNITLVTEALFKAKTSDIYRFLVIGMAVFMAFMLTAYLLPDELYTIFTKANLYALIMIIFMPYCLEMTAVLLVKEERREVLLKEKRLS